VRSGAWLRYLVGGALCVVVHALLPRSFGRDLLGVVISATVVVAVIAGVRANRPVTRKPWLTLAGGAASLIFGDLVFALSAWRGVENLARLADVAYVVGYVTFCVGLVRLARSRRPEGNDRGLVDAAVVGVAVAFVCVVLFVTPAWEAQGAPADREIAVVRVVADVMLLVQFLHVRIAGTRGTASLRFLFGALLAALVTDLVLLTAPYVPSIAADAHPVTSLWLLGYVLAGVAAMHPSMALATEPQATPAPRKTVLKRELTILTAAVCLIPFVLVVEMVGGVTPHVLEAAFASITVVSLVHVRMVGMAKESFSQAERIARLADIDVQTGLANLRRFTDEVEQRLADPRAPAVPLLLVELDRFTEINDTLGHRVGDELLRGVAARMTSVVAEHGMVARVGGDSFAVIVEDESQCTVEVLECAERLRRELVAPFELLDVTVSIDARIGVAIGPDDGTSVDDLLHRADIALSTARDCTEKVARYSGHTSFEAAYAPHLIGELSAALVAGDVVVHYQPQVIVGTGLVYGVEALVRWQHPLHGLLPPAAFIPAAERTGLIRPLTLYVLNRALEDSTKWRRNGHDLAVSVNLSVRDLLDPDFVGEVREAVARHKVAPRSLELEVTETMAMLDPARSLAVLEGLDAMGVTLSVDDYGTGYSSLAYLQRLPVHRLKIDRSFVTGMVEDRASAAIVYSTIELARHLGMTVVAEGVEDDATLLALREMGCDAAQGFGLGRPVPAEDLLPLVAVIEERVPRVLRQGVPVGRRMV
jgi:diguanylate cyclase (GGDEF)-like protein